MKRRNFIKGALACLAAPLAVATQSKKAACAEATPPANLIAEAKEADGFREMSMEIHTNTSRAQELGLNNVCEQDVVAAREMFDDEWNLDYHSPLPTPVWMQALTPSQIHTLYESQRINRLILINNTAPNLTWAGGEGTIKFSGTGE